MKINSAAKKAILIGGMCSLSYLAVYIARNILSAVTPQMIEDGKYTTENIGKLSSVYFITYAFGQLINGIIGDKIKAKYMISLGLILAGLGNFVFAIPSVSYNASYIAYAFIGFFLSMIYGPMTKLVAENTEPIYTTRCSLGYTFSSFFGSPIAGVLAVFLTWQSVFIAGGITLLAMGALCFTSFTLFERKGIIKYNQYQQPKQNGGGIKLLLERQIVKFTLISFLTGIVRTTVVFWMPTYMTQYLDFSPKTSASIFTIAALIISISSFVSIFLYEKLGHNMNLTILISFLVSAKSFLTVFIISVPAINITFLVLAIFASNCAATMMWSRYCPSLKDTGHVSGATGFLDFISYIAASISTTIFAKAVANIGWNYIVLIWFILMVIGTIVSLPYKKQNYI